MRLHPYISFAIALLAISSIACEITDGRGREVASVRNMIVECRGTTGPLIRGTGATLNILGRTRGSIAYAMAKECGVFSIDFDGFGFSWMK